MWIHKAITTVLGLGYIPKAPGTFGALGAMALISILKLSGIVVFDFYLILIIILLLAIGTYSTHKLLKAWGDDPSRIVIDEFAGYLTSLLFITPSWINLILAFALFRFFDIIKPLGISYIDQNVKGAWGVMFDDVLAGIYTCITLHLISVIFNF